MKIIIVIIGMLACISLFAQNPWETVYHNDNKHSSFRIMDIKSYGNNVTATGFHGILNSSDGGATWKNLYAGTNMGMMEACYLNDTTIWVCGNNGTIVKYDLKNKKYYDFSIKDYSFNAIYFIDELNGLVSTWEGEVLLTKDSGKNWKQVFNHGKNCDCKIRFKNKLEGYFLWHSVLDNKSELHGTIDGGLTWNLVADMPDEIVNNMYIIDGEIWLVGYYGLLTKSSDGGKTWQWFNRKFSEPIHSMAKINDDFYIVAGKDEHRILQSTDNAKTWKPIYEADYHIKLLNANKDYLYSVNMNARSIIRKKISSIDN